MITTATATAGTPTLHHLSSSQSLRVLWALEELAELNGLKYNLQTYKRKKARAPPELARIFPLGKSPILVVEPVLGAGGSAGADVSPQIVTESRLILQFIADHYSGGAWTPTTPAARTRDTFYQEFANATLAFKVDFVMIFDLIAPATPLLLRPLPWAIFTPLANMLKKDLVGPLDLMEAALSDGGGGDYFAGDRLGLADFNMSWPLDMALQRKYLDPKKYPKVKMWIDRIHARPAYQRALKLGGSYDLVAFDM